MPKEEVEELVLHNTRNENDEWVGERYHKGCWIFMQPAAIGPHRVRRRGVLDQHWKGRLLGFKRNKVEGMVAIVQHVYSHSDIHLHSQGDRKGFTSNCNFLNHIVYLLQIVVPLFTTDFPLFFSPYRHISIYFS